MTLTSPWKSIGSYEEIPFQTLLQRAAERWPDKTAIIDGDNRASYAELLDRSNRLASALAERGVAKGDRVALLAPNCLEYVVAAYGVISSGAVLTTINSGYREGEIAHQLNHSGAETLIVHESLLEVTALARPNTPKLMTLIVIGNAVDGSESLDDLIESGSSTPPDVTVRPRDDLAALPYSSGTTGLSKGVMLTHFNLTANIQQFLQRGGEESSWRHEDVILVHLPLFHIYGLNVLMGPAIAAGATQVMMGRFDMETLLSIIEQERITIFCTVPPVILGLTAYPGLSERDLSSLRLGFVAAAPSSADLQDRGQDALGCPLIQGYGMTELSPITHLDYMRPPGRSAGSVGFPLPDTETRVVDVEDGVTDVDIGEEGELLVRGPQVMKGYFDDPDATAETITADGWLHTGDIVKTNSEGRLWITDRKKELIKFKGFQVPPAELEGLLLEHPDVADACVVGKQDAEAGEVPKAFVVPRDGSTASAEDLMSFVASKVASFKQIHEVEFIDQIPKSPTGKILRRILREREHA
ncbi:MAG: AMP-binding protein [Chloroflexi bacterium]|nr:AMP-binding protein [Chloroflexota bacterium]